MVRRGFLSYLSAALVALALLCGTTGSSIGGPEASAAPWSAKTGTAPAVRDSLSQDLPDGALNPRADQDDTPDDRVIGAGAIIEWPQSTTETRILDTSEQISPSHRPCAARPRAPPTA